MFDGKFHEWSRDPVRPHDGPCWWLRKKRKGREKKKREEKRGLSRFPQPSSLMKKWIPWDYHRNSFSDSRHAYFSDVFGRQSRVDGLWV